MPTIDLQVSNFTNPYTGLNGSTNPKLTRLKCIKFAKTVGISHFTRAFSRTQTALSLAAYRAMAIRCVLDFGQATLVPHAQYRRLESTEKVNLSYWIGMTFTAFAADHILGVPRTIHALQGNQTIRRANPKSKSLADLIGQDAGAGWHVLEAKGRQTAPSAQDRIDWKDQSQTILSINGAAVSTRSYCVGLLKNPCRIELEDPPSNPPRRPVNLTISLGAFGYEYYRPYIDFLQQGSSVITRQNRKFRVKPIMFDPISQEYIYTGLESIYYTLEEDSADFRFKVGAIDEPDFYCGSDGIVVAAHKDPCSL